jgi:predicted transcriptional regulator
MSNQELFVREIEEILNNYNITLSENANKYFQILKVSKNEKPKFTENGKVILKYLQDNKDTYNNIFSAKSIGEGLSISSKGVSGALRKLVNDGYVDKAGNSPVCYSINQKGIEVNIEEEEA